MIKKMTIMNQLQILAEENIVSIRDIQRNPSRALKGVSRVIKNNRTIGFYFDKEAYENLLEEEAMLNNPRFLKKIAEARKEAREGKIVPFEEILKEYGL